MIATNNFDDENNIKLTIVNNAVMGDNCSVEIFVNREYLNKKMICSIIEQRMGIAENVYLTQREKETLMLAASGKSNGEIAKSMNISVHTAKIHLSNIFQKLNAKDRTEAVIKAFLNNLINIMI